MKPTIQPDLFPERTTTMITVRAVEADTAVARVRALGGVLLSFSTIGGGRIALHVILPAGELLEEWRALEGER
jgi:hypothetical protein